MSVDSTVAGLTPPASTPPPDPPVRFARLKMLGVLFIGGLIAFNGLSDVDHVTLFGSEWGPRSRIISAILLGGFYAFERYITRSGTWYKPDP